MAAKKDPQGEVLWQFSAELAVGVDLPTSATECPDLNGLHKVCPGISQLSCSWLLFFIITFRSYKTVPAYTV